MAKLLKLRRGTDTQHNSFTGAEGEVTVNTTNDSLHVHDGSTAGGTELAKADLSNVDGSLSNNLGFADNTKALFGTGNDLEIEHTGSGSFIRTSTTATGDLAIEARNGGDLYLTGADDVEIRPQGGEAGIKVIGNGAVELYHDSSKKLNTTSWGINVTGSVQCDGITSDGTATIQSGQGQVIIKDSNSTGNAANAELVFAQSDGTDLGYTGYVSATDSVYSMLNKQNAEIRFGTNNTWRCLISSSGHFIPYADNSYDLGTSTTQWRDGYFDGTVNCDGLQVVGGVGITGNLTMSADDGRMIVKDNNNTGVASTARIEGQQSNAATKWRLGNLSSGTDALYFGNNENADIVFFTNNADRCSIDGSGHFVPASNNTYDLGTSSLRWRNVYTNDLNLSNEGSTNDVDGTWGSWTIQEGEDDLFLLNRRNGKKYKFNLSEVN